MWHISSLWKQTWETIIRLNPWNLPQPLAARSVMWWNGTGLQLRCLHNLEATAEYSTESTDELPMLGCQTLWTHVCSLKLTWLMITLLLIVTVEGGRLLVQIQVNWKNEVSSEKHIEKRHKNSSVTDQL